MSIKKSCLLHLFLILFVFSPLTVGAAGGAFNYYLPYLSTADGDWTGLALANANKSIQVLATVKVYGQDGTLLLDITKTLEKNGQTAFPILPPTAVKGWIYVNSYQPLSGLAFLGVGGSISLMVDIPFVRELSSDMIIPHIAQDSTWDTSALICNPQAVPVRVTLNYVDQNGLAKGTQSYTIAAHGSGEYDLSALSGGVAMAGKVYIKASQGVAAFALYSNVKSGGTYFAGINAEACE